MFGFLKKKASDTNLVSSLGLISKEDGTVMERNLYYANKGGVLFNYYVGREYAYGIEKGDERHSDGLEPNVDKALHYLTYAAEREIVDAQTLLGIIYMGDLGEEYKNDEEALKWIKRAASAGDSSCQFLLGTMYATGTIVEKNEDLSFNWYLESATRGFDRAMVSLSDYYRDKLLTFPEEMTDEEENLFQDYIWLSYKWNRIAAEYGNAEGMFMTGVAFYKGFGVAQDLDESRKFLEMAVENGNDDAKEFLAENF